VTQSLAPARERIVVVDDSWIILEQIRLCLSGFGYDVRTTTGLEVASRLVQNAELAIVDFHMPGLNGEEFVRLLRAALPAGASCLFYLYTSDRDEAGRYEQHGFDGAFLKKGDEEALVPQVEAVFRTVRMRRVAERLRRERGGS
jgi:two-component system, NtrC family, sensor kinase